MVWEPIGPEQGRRKPGLRTFASRTHRRWGLALALSVLLFSSVFWVGVGADGDGLPTYRELRLGTDPFRTDTDGDGLADGWEVARGLDPLRTDTDDDGLADRDEVRIHRSDPRQSDTDGDGLHDGEEVPRGIDPTRADTDGDDADDLLEVTRRSDPLRPDTDGDGLDDGQEHRFGIDPLSSDTDGDGMSDAIEAALPDTDCDGDGLHAAADLDDDGDGIGDADEEEAWRCEPDVDGDGVLDGFEGAFSCITRRDCDLDGLEDGVEAADLDFEPLDPDTFRVGLLDSVVYTFRERGQSPSGDADDDGIPDTWESGNGLIDWGAYQPKAGQNDLLVEFIRVQGPQSQKVAHLDFTPAYREVANAFEAQGGITFQWVETRIALGAEARPPVIPSYDHPYYADVLSRSRYADNPYVLTVVMNPQHDQSQVRHAGIAPIRGMLAAVDYGFFTQMVFEANNQTVAFKPYWESLIAADKEQGQYGHTLQNAGVAPSGEYYVRGNTFTAYWSPLWFQTAPRYEFDSGGIIQTQFSHATVEIGPLAGVIMHEIGHTLGLCHLELEDCSAHLTVDEKEQRARSSMYSASALSTVAFLATEWAQVATYLGCPPQGPIVVLSEGGDRHAVLTEKYTVAEADILNVDTRSCGDHTPIPSEFQGDLLLGGWEDEAGRVDPGRLDGPHRAHLAPASMADPGPAGSGWGGFVVLLLAALGLAGLAFAAPSIWPRQGPWAGGDRPPSGR